MKKGESLGQKVIYREFGLKKYFYCDVNTIHFTHENFNQIRHQHISVHIGALDMRHAKKLIFVVFFQRH